MRDLNSVSLIGRLTRDADLKYTNTGIPVLRLSLAVNRNVKKDGQFVDEVSFFNVVVWNKIAEALNQYLLKGKQIAITGELRQNRFESNGEKKSIVEITAHTIQLLGGDKQNNQQPQQRPQAQQFQEPQMESSKPQNVRNDDFTYDIPF